METFTATLTIILQWYVMTVGWGLTVKCLPLILFSYGLLLVPSILMDLMDNKVKDLKEQKDRMKKFKGLND